jgi:hypothetical protein
VAIGKGAASPTNKAGVIFIYDPKSLQSRAARLKAWEFGFLPSLGRVRASRKKKLVLVSIKAPVFKPGFFSST